MRLNSMEALLIHELKDLHSAESQLIRALPKMAKAASSERLREVIEVHFEETKRQKDRLDQIFDGLESSPRGMKCKAMEGLVAEGEDLLKEEGDAAVKDAALIAAAQRVEHYEIAGYGAAVTFAHMLDKQDVAQLLQESLDEEKAADQKLNELAFAEVNPSAAGR
ncbi:MAG: ferritin-like domain-containing protein [Candidatus Hydrogenedentes bacterium]|nr:ferritin-like domain-containing protein [Candidatus Hydrogenedentota bacterium]